MCNTWAMNICRRHFLKLRISVQTCSSTWRVLATCSAGTIRQCPGTSRPLLQGKTSSDLINGLPPVARQPYDTQLRPACQQVSACWSAIFCLEICSAPEQTGRVCAFVPELNWTMDI